ncbi:alpha-galactosidase [Alkalicoccus urumqiensis]|uniref:Alpha-galactosidase n=2 Tax=Alkalicoccus urumqiensis TaxID=1548213 RepID=A0A2P6MM24_ALKUR|nr:alpha-galactosidase [Alkalicoccus urumqiensis]
MTQSAAIHVEEKTGVFHLQGPGMSYVMKVQEGGYLTHLYWGRRLSRYRGSADVRYEDRGFSGNPNKEDRTFSLDTTPLEYPAYGNTDYRDPAFEIEWADGSRVSDFRYKSYTVQKGKPALDGLPASYAGEAEAETLIIELRDELQQVSIFLRYTVFHASDALARSASIVHEGGEPFVIQKASSANVDFRSRAFEYIHLPGAHNRERDMVRTPLGQSRAVVESRRGSSSHQQNPFFALVRPDATETSGEVFAWNLVYSGSFLASAEVDQFDGTRVNVGIQPFGFSWELSPGETFTTPEAVLVYSSEGLGQMSRTFHHLYGEHLVRGSWKHRTRPVLINNWEATYFDFDEKKILEIASRAAEAEIELFVLDDGWFGRRDDDRSSLGDWTVDERKLPDGVQGLAEKVKEAGMDFGIWVEPEMISVDSDLYRAHPDWCLHVPGRRRSESRNQLVLDFANPEVRAHILEQLRTLLAGAPISYVKWDMNRNMTEIGSPVLPAHRQQETAHRYMLGLYDVMEKLTQEFPEVLFESCSGGGGRFDPGMLYYMPQTWTSDNTDAVSRTRIQYGTSLAYPSAAMGAHVSDVPNHQVGRTTPLAARGHVAMEANLGYELDVTKLSDAEMVEIRDQVRRYKEVRHLSQYGTLYRLADPFQTESYATIRVSSDRSEALFVYMHRLAEANAPFVRVKLDGLKPDAVYSVDGLDRAFGGDELMYAGIDIPVIEHDFQSHLWHLKEVKA